MNETSPSIHALRMHAICTDANGRRWRFLQTKRPQRCESCGQTRPAGSLMFIDDERAQLLTGAQRIYRCHSLTCHSLESSLKW